MLQAIFDAYIRHFPDDASKLKLLAGQLAEGQPMDDRKNFSGHVTGAAIVLSPDHSKVLMIHHRFLDMWLQPGGHWDPGESDPLHAARREAREETAVQIGRYLPLDAANPLVPIHIETHAIPANPAKAEAGHFHHDFRYVFQAADEKLLLNDAETNAVCWFDLDVPETAQITEVLQRVKSLVIA